MLNQSSMAIFLLMFAIMGCLDEVFYHHLKHGLFTHSECFKENILHAVRALLYFILFIVVANFEVSGIYALLMLGVLFIDVIVGVWDILEEPKSREKFGGLSRGEYLLHMCLSFNLGIFYFNYILYLIPKVSGPSIIVSNQIPYFVKFGLSGMGIGCLLLFLYTILSLIRINKARHI